MADVFISYSHKDRRIAADLANFLGGLGYDVWWDYELVGGSNFRDQILDQLRAAKAVVGIWSAFSIDTTLSKWPREEMAEADRLGTLIPVKVPELAFYEIPLGYRDYQTDLVTEPDRLLKAFEQKGVAPSKKDMAPPPATAAPVVIAGLTVDPAIVDAAQQFASWKAIEASSNPQHFRDFLTSNIDSPLAEVARVRLAKFEQAAIVEVEADPSAARIQGFLKDYPDSPRRNDLMRRLYSLESQAWGEVARSRNADRISAFLATFPSGHFAGEARELLRELRLSAVEAAAWKKLGAAPTAEQLEGFIKEFPLGAYVDEARTRLREVRKSERRAKLWAEVKSQPYNEPIRRFIAEFGDGPEVEAAQALLVERRKAREDGDWAKVKSERHAAPILAFLREHPGGAHEKAATALVRDLPRLNEAEAWAVVRDAGRPDLTQLFSGLFPDSQLVRPPPVRPPTVEPSGQGRSAAPVAGLVQTSVASSHRILPAGLLAAAALAVISAILVNASFAPRNGSLFAAGLVLGSAAIFVMAVYSGWRGLRDSSAWSLMSGAIAFNVLAAAWTLAIVLPAPTNIVGFGSIREVPVVWLLAVGALWLHHTIMGTRTSPRAVRGLVRVWAAIVHVGLVLAAIASLVGIAGSIGYDPTYAGRTIQRLLFGFAFTSSCSFSCTNAQTYIAWAGLAAGLLTAVTGLLAGLQSIRDRELWA
jgi:hypothetical protein